METQLMNLILWPYLIMVLLAGGMLSQDGVAAPFPSRVRLTLQRVPKFYRVLILSLLIGLAYHRWMSPDATCEQIVVTFLLSNTVYEVGAKHLLNKLWEVIGLKG